MNWFFFSSRKWISNQDVYQKYRRFGTRNVFRNVSVAPVYSLTFSNFVCLPYKRFLLGSFICWFLGHWLWVSGPFSVGVIFTAIAWHNVDQFVSMDSFRASISVHMRTCFMSVLQTRDINMDNVINNKKITTAAKLHAHPCSAWDGNSIQIAWREPHSQALEVPRKHRN